MRSHYSGSLLIEITVATGVFLVGLTAVFLTFIQVNRSSVRNKETSLALNLIASQIEKDSQLSYDTLNNASPLLTSNQLPSAIIERYVIQQAQREIKTIRYVVQWKGTYGPRTIQSDYEITPLGLLND